MLILASQSPRRAALLKQINVPYVAKAQDIDETPLAGESPAAYVERLAIEKARAALIFAQPNDRVLGADTTVVYQGEILGKPANLQECSQTLGLLSGNTHSVFTAVALLSHKYQRSMLVETRVSFKPLSSQEIEDYWYSGEPNDKAGAYGIQGLGGQFVTNINGSYSGVVGLPLYETKLLLDQMDNDHYEL